MGIGASSNRTGKISTRSNFMYVEWKVRDLFSFPNDLDACICSASFQLKDAKWYLRLYPNGQKDFLTAGYMDLLLVKEDSATPTHRVNFHIGIYKGDGTVHKSCGSDEEFTTNDKGWGAFYLIKRSDLNDQRRNLAPESVVTFFCYLQVNSGRSIEESKHAKPAEGVERLVKDFKNLLKSGEDNDVTIVVKDRKFKVHKAILRARSSVFSSMLSHDMTEKNSGLIHIVDCEPEAFQVFLMYLYSGYIENLSSEAVFSLYFVADKYDVEEIKTRCVSLMTSNLSIQTLCDVVSLSLLHDETALLDAAVDFFSRHTKEIMSTTQWQSLLKENPTAANELYLKALEYKAKQK